MIFGLGKKKAKQGSDSVDAPEADKTKAKSDADKKAGKAAKIEADAPTGTALGSSQLRRKADLTGFGFETTADIEPLEGLIGQDRALGALKFGAGMPESDYNIFVLGTDSCGKTAAVRQTLEELAKSGATPDDWVYVHNFEDANAPNAVRLPAGRGKALAKAMTDVIDELTSTLPAAFESEDYLSRARALEAEHTGSHEARLQALSDKAEERGIAFLRTPMGFTFAPMLEGKVVKPEAFEAMPPSMQAEVRQNIEALQKELETILLEVPRLEKSKRKHLRLLNEEVAQYAVNSALEEISAEFGDIEEVGQSIENVRADLVANASLFLDEEASGATSIVPQTIDSSRDPRFRRYMVNALIAQPANRGGAPVIEAVNPTYGNIIGRSEHLAHMGALVTDFLLIKPGALHTANGGYLLIDARKLVAAPFAWDALKRALQTGHVQIEHPAESTGLVATQSIDPEPIPLDIKVVLFGDRELYALLSRADPEFQELFKVQADFEDTVDWDDENLRGYAAMIAAVSAKHELAPLDREAVEAVIEQGSRLASDRNKLSIEVSRIADLVREANYWAQKADRQTIAREDVQRAIAEHIQRADRIRDLDRETFERGIVMVDTEGEKVGQINGLSVLQLGDFMFGRPSRITARVRFGPGRVVDIEREVKLGGPLHSKGVMILWGYLAGTFAKDKPLALSASLVFEQSYGGVDGDSASSTELYALLSALSGVAIKQGFAVTGSVNQLGEVQAIGGVNEKIEGFFDICNARGLTGEQGVLIPKANVQHLMLREDVVEAVADGQFSVHAVATIEEGIEILTGMPAGVRGADGTFPKDTVFAKVEDTLATFARRAKEAGSFDGGPGAAVSKGATS